MLNRMYSYISSALTTTATAATTTIRAPIPIEDDSEYVILPPASRPQKRRADKIKRAKNFGPLEMPSNFSEQHKRYFDSMLEMLKIYRDEKEMEFIMNAASVEFSLLMHFTSLQMRLLTHEDVNLTFSQEQIQNSVDSVIITILTHMVNLDYARKRYFLDNVMPLLERYNFSNKTTFLNCLKTTNSSSEEVLWFWNEICKDPQLNNIITKRVRLSLIQEQNRVINDLQALLKSAVSYGYVLSAKGIKDSLGINAALFENSDIDKLIEYNLSMQKIMLEKELLQYTRRNYSLLSEVEKEAYVRGMQHIIAEVGKKSWQTQFFAKRPRLTFLAPVNLFDKDLFHSLMASNIVNVAHEVFKTLFKESKLPLALYFPTLTLSFSFILQLTAKYSNNFRDLAFSQNQYMVQRYKENLALTRLNDRLPEWARFYQKENYLNGNETLESAFLKRQANNFTQLMELDNFHHSVLALLAGMVVRSSLEAIANKSGLENTLPGTVVYITLLLLMDLVLKPHVINYARTIDNATRHSEERYQGYIVSDQKFLDACNAISTSASKVGSMMLCGNRLWQKAASVVNQPKTSTMQIEVIGDEKTNNDQPAVVSSLRKL